MPSHYYPAALLFTNTVATVHTVIHTAFSDIAVNTIIHPTFSDVTVHTVILPSSVMSQTIVTVVPPSVVLPYALVDTSKLC